ncbi:MAG: aminomethyl-transferring glycine dehydrogenase, partial [Gammaproteobacteria bacterium]|nr:aminomethyl-transferring glycine dehydrogenase [Gammaproteobacteria bacterium]
HGPEGLFRIAERVHSLTATLAEGLTRLGFTLAEEAFFDTLSVHTAERTPAIHAAARRHHINLRELDAATIGIALDETVSWETVEMLWSVFADAEVGMTVTELKSATAARIPDPLRRTSRFLAHPVFNRYHSETEMLRYLRRLGDKDLALDRAMIPLGSCTMKLNATTELAPVSWSQFSDIHPFAPADQARGYADLIRELEDMLCRCTGYDGVSLQPNAGSQGEFAGLLAIRTYHQSRGEGRRDVCLIPSSAHGTNPASAYMAGLKVVVIDCDARGNVDVSDVRAKAAQYSANLAAIMLTYPSTHGVFEEAVTEICDIVHQHGGQVYIDGANLNAQVGLCRPGRYGGDVSHFNLHKTFCIPHGGGGPGVGPIGVRAHLVPFLPARTVFDEPADYRVGPVSAAPWGSAGILPISWTYIALMGDAGLTAATQVAILNANYIAARLGAHFPVLYTGPHGRVAHECIIDLRAVKETTGITVDDVAKRLIDYGFHAPTMSFPVPGTFMIEPTESESKTEIDRFCEALISIREEIQAVATGAMDAADNPLKNAPHTVHTVTGDKWSHPYSREQAAFPVASLRTGKYWSPVGRIDNAYGDRILVCSCPPLSAHEQAA